TASPADEVTLFDAAPGVPDVLWGPATKPLWRPDIFNRSRMVVVAHTEQPHQTATPLTLTGHKLGHPRLAGKGSAIQHQWMSKSLRSVPYSFVLTPDD